MTDHVARAEVMVDAAPDTVWGALTEPDQVRSWMVGTELSTDWRVGSPITWRGEMNGSPYEDKGEVLENDEPRHLSFSHYSPLMGQEDRPENYHTVTYDLAPTADGERTTVTLTQDGNESAEQARQFSENWQSMLDALKRTVEA
ncbi:ATPase [Intrasporangium oryzae NRRL B-24470]|uniref:ATPase n=1 Tax=Intrasporangium oryzae NRRL B-24470 TaxID=1386089 RepID=W9G602_9MICO|nr:SRPBCC domain-containing protein [Intrasporangium oryzae]EWT01576.1 ATPase [Intrasporangium oryzae NRRL B-24470]